METFAQTPRATWSHAVSRRSSHPPLQACRVRGALAGRGGEEQVGAGLQQLGPPSPLHSSRLPFPDPDQQMHTTQRLTPTHTRHALKLPQGCQPPRGPILQPGRGPEARAGERICPQRSPSCPRQAGNRGPRRPPCGRRAPGPSSTPTALRAGNGHTRRQNPQKGAHVCVYFREAAKIPAPLPWQPTSLLPPEL